MYHDKTNFSSSSSICFVLFFVKEEKMPFWREEKDKIKTFL